MSLGKGPSLTSFQVFIFSLELVVLFRCGGLPVAGKPGLRPPHLFSLVVLKKTTCNKRLIELKFDCFFICHTNYTGQTKCRLLKRVIHVSQQNWQKFAPTQTLVITQPPPCLDGWFQDTGVRLQVELQKKDEWSSFHQRKETWPHCSKGCLHIEVIPLTSQHLDVDTIKWSPNFSIKLLMMSYGCRTKYWVFTE